MNDEIKDMDSTRAYKFRIYPDTTRQAEIDERLILAQQFYNKILEKSIAAYQNGKTKVSMAQFNRFVKEIIQEDKKYLKLYSQTRCEIEYRLLKAYRNFFRRIKEGNRKAGFPRFRSRDRYKTITYPQDNGAFAIEKERKANMLRVSRIGRMKIDMHRQIEGTVKTLTIKKEAGDYYAIFTTAQKTEMPKIKDANPIGIDVGLTTFAALSDGTMIRKPKFARTQAKKISRWQRVVARRTKWEGRKKAKQQSRNRNKATIKLQEAWQEVNNQNRDFIQKETTNLVTSGLYTSFVVEDLQIGNMVKNHHYARSIQEATWGMFKTVLSYKAESAGMGVIPVPYAYTSQTCSRCRNVKQGKDRLQRGDRIYQCFACGLVLDRDTNASMNILEKALNSASSNFDSVAVKAREGHSRSNASGDVTSTIQPGLQVASMNQEHTLRPQGKPTRFSGGRMSHMQPI